MTLTLEGWLQRLEARSPESRMKLGLDRVSAVYSRLLPAGLGVPVVSVSGTNGKGSVVAFLESILGAAGLRVLAYSSPHLLEFGERIRIDGSPAGPDRIARALDVVETARRDTALTYFEHVTLAAFWLASRQNLDAAVLEVGLGGRLDAVNVVDADLAVISSIGLDHQQWLGRTRSRIAAEKAGIARPGRPLVVAERRRTQGMEDCFSASGAKVLLAGRDFRWRFTRQGLQIRLPGGGLDQAVRPGLAGRHQGSNAAAAALAARLLGDRLPVDDGAIIRGLQTASLPGRFQVVRERPRVIVDVAHNPAAARALRDRLAEAPGPTFAVFAALADKDAAAMARALDRHIQCWYLAGLPGSRGRSASELADLMLTGHRGRPAVTGRVETLESVPDALAAAMEAAGPDHRVVVFGSFLTVAEALRNLN